MTTEPAATRLLALSHAQWLWAGAAAFATSLMLIAGASGINQSIWWVFLVYMAPMPIFAVGLSQGQMAGPVAAILTLLLLALLGNLGFSLSMGLLLVLPPALLCVLAMRHRTDANGQVYWYPAGLLLPALLAYGLLFFVIIVIVFSGEEGGLQGHIARAGQEFITARMSELPAAASAEGPSVEEQIQLLQTGLATIMQFLPGVMLSSWAMFMAISGMAVQRALQGQGLARRPDPTLYNFFMPLWLYGLLFLAGLAAFAGEGVVSFVGTNFFIVLCLPLFLQGMSVFHCWARQNSYGWLLLVPLYISMLFGWPFLLATLLGALEPLLQIRRRIFKIEL